MNIQPRKVFVTGGTGYMGSRLIPMLLQRGHRWPYVLLPFYGLGELVPCTRASAQRLGLVTLGKMLNALVWAVENPPTAVQILDVPSIRALRMVS